MSVARPVKARYTNQLKPHQVFLVPPEGGDAVQLTDASGAMHSLGPGCWSPDGRVLGPGDAPPPKKISYGTLNLQSAPWAVVEIDGKRVGQTPLVDFRIASGKHRLTLTNPGLPKKTVKIVVPANQPVNETVTLTD